MSKPTKRVTSLQSFNETAGESASANAAYWSDTPISCNWRVSRRGAFETCGKPVEQGKQYCASHEASAKRANSTAEYDAILIHGVREDGDRAPDGRNYVSVDDVNPQFYSVYFHTTKGLVEWIEDFSSNKQATAYAVELADAHNLPIFDKSKPDQTN